MPVDRFKRHKESLQWRTLDRTQKHDFLTLHSQKCPSCKQMRVTVKKLETKVVVLCNNCFLEYVFTKYPAFEEVDYYDKMLDTFRQDVRDGKVSPAAMASPEKILGECRLCGQGQWAIVEIGSGRRFVRCSNGDCRRVFSLPNKGDFEPAKDICKNCGWPLLFWEFRTSGAFAVCCFNPSCGYRSEWKGYTQKV